MPDRAVDPKSPICRAIRRLREHSRACDCVETRRVLIATERWMVWMLRWEEGEPLPVPSDTAG
ncbi:hypothetical protein [Azospirillum sp. TSO35-2]|uniref:hypothetical protein n=1 Tax=Azospirillum sp. TSO35-2 TaxID=716796 RepID=UPI000D60E0D5|nr:hypothetical protein [Azospirillum sp. TSO35-2]PWC34103.1 hypothetical protein TSO352_27735 [Azospirillum sp. TSO35-2]